MSGCETQPSHIPYSQMPREYIPQELRESELYVASRQLVLRSLATARLANRRDAAAAGRSFDADEWLPDAERLYHLGDADNLSREPLAGAHRIGRYLGMAANMAAYAGTLEDSSLRPEDQIEPFRELLWFYHPADAGEQLPLDVTLAHVLGGGYGAMATGFGKMAIMATFAKAAGIGQHPFGDPTLPPYKALILAGSKNNLDQLAGTDVYDGFAKFAPDIQMSEYTRRARSLEGDGVLTHYLMWERAMKERRFAPELFDLLLPDEAHHMLGPGMQRSHELFRQAGIPTLALTATPEYRADHTLQKVLRYEICNIDKLDLIEIGSLSALQLYWAATGSSFKVSRGRGDYTEKELHDLAHDPDRNALMLGWMKLFAERDGIR